jgi:hypothetical protein
MRHQKEKVYVKDGLSLRRPSGEPEDLVPGLLDFLRLDVNIPLRR